MTKNELKRIGVVATAILLTLALSGAGCAKKSPTSAEMDFTYRAQEKAALEEFWKNDTPYVVVQMLKDNKFSPQTVTVPAGRSIMWQNSDRIEHLVAADEAKWMQRSVGVNSSGDGGLISPKIGRGTGWRWQLPKDIRSGTKIYYHCALHGTKGDGKSFGTGMVGLIIVK